MLSPRLTDAATTFFIRLNFIFIYLCRYRNAFQSRLFFVRTRFIKNTIKNTAYAIRYPA